MILERYVKYIVDIKIYQSYLKNTENDFIQSQPKILTLKVFKRYSGCSKAPGRVTKT